MILEGGIENIGELPADLFRAGAGRQIELNENCLPIASILSDHGRLAARTGMGALMGSKNLKALAVRGSAGAQQLPLARPEEYRKLRVASNKALLEQNMIGDDEVGDEIAAGRHMRPRVCPRLGGRRS